MSDGFEYEGQQWVERLYNLGRDIHYFTNEALDPIEVTIITNGRKCAWYNHVHAESHLSAMLNDREFVREDEWDDY